MKNKLICENIRVPVTAAEDEIIRKAERRFASEGISFDADSVRVHKKSVDARHKNNILFVCSVIADTNESPRIAGDIKIRELPCYEQKRGNETLDGRPFIIGLGPAGIFCALTLAEAGLRPVVFERGACVQRRVDAVERFYVDGELDTNTNIQFGAGGAGTFSDGKLTTRIGDASCDYILQRLHAFGAPEDIIYRAKPHVGTDILRKVIENAAREITALGGEIHYESTLDDIDGRILTVAGEKFKAGCTVLATGHSARDTYKMLMRRGYDIAAKPFSVGVRAEHLQRELDIAMYGSDEICQITGHAEYQMSWRQGERGVYTFCMCPGGEVVAAASECGGVVTNGMSRRARDSKNGNAAVAVSVLPSDFGGSPEAAIEFQRSMERAAFAAGSRGGAYFAPCQLLGDFMNDRRGGLNSRIRPSYMNGKVQSTVLSELMPDFEIDMLKKGFRRFGGIIKGYDAADVPLTGPETRTSAPVRIIRGEDMTAPSNRYLYPCGEGAGYAGGIMSAAADGLKAARAILERFGD